MDLRLGTMSDRGHPGDSARRRARIVVLRYQGDGITARRRRPVTYLLKERSRTISSG